MAIDTRWDRWEKSEVVTYALKADQSQTNQIVSVKLDRRFGGGVICLSGPGAPDVYSKIRQTVGDFLVFDGYGSNQGEVWTSVDAVLAEDPKKFTPLLTKIFEVVKEVEPAFVQIVPEITKELEVCKEKHIDFQNVSDCKSNLALLKWERI